MGTLIKQECFKLFKKKSTFIAPIVFYSTNGCSGYIATKYNEILRHRNLLHLLIMVFMVCIFINYSSKYNHFNGISLRYD